MLSLDLSVYDCFQCVCVWIGSVADVVTRSLCIWLFTVCVDRVRS